MILFLICSNHLKFELFNFYSMKYSHAYCKSRPEHICVQSWLTAIHYLHFFRNKGTKALKPHIVQTNKQNILSTHKTILYYVMLCNLVYTFKDICNTFFFSFNNVNYSWLLGGSLLHIHFLLLLLQLWPWSICTW